MSHHGEAEVEAKLARLKEKMREAVWAATLSPPNPRFSFAPPDWMVPLMSAGTLQLNGPSLTCPECRPPLTFRPRLYYNSYTNYSPSNKPIVEL